MGAFVASAPALAAAPPAEDIVAGDGFWPEVSIAAFRDAQRIGNDVTDARARDALRGAILHVRRELLAWATLQLAAGSLRLGDVGSAMIDGIAAAELLYRRAVYCAAAADLAETHNTVSATGDGRDRALEDVSAADELRRNATHAIRDILGVTRTSVELI